MKKVISSILLGIGIIIIFLFIKSIDLNILTYILASLDKSSLLTLLLYVFTSIIVKAVRWQFLMLEITKMKVSFWQSVIANIAGVAGGSLMPGRVDLVKPLMMKNNYSIKMSHSLSAIMIERALDLLTLLLIAVLSSAFLFRSSYFNQNIINSSIFFLLTIIVLAAIVLLTFFPHYILRIFRKAMLLLPLSTSLKQKIEDFVTNLVQGFTTLKSEKFAVLMIILSFLTIGLEVVRLYFLFNFLGLPATLTAMGLMLSASVIIGVVAMIPGGTGITEFSAAGILSLLLLTIPFEVIKSAVLIDRFLAYYLLLFIGSIILIFSHLRTTRSQKF